MKQIQDFIKINESSDWTWDDECNDDGKIAAQFSSFSDGGRTYNTVHWELELLEEDDDFYHVNAVCVHSDIRKIKKGFEFEFDLDKSCSVWDIDDEVKRAYEEETNYGGRG